jgi:hypothetical protein
MVTNASLTRVSGGGNITVDLELIANPAADVLAMTSAELRAAGVTKGTRVQQTALQPVFVQEPIPTVQAMVRAALALPATSSPSLIGGAILRDQMPGPTEVFNAAGPTIVAGLRITIVNAGTYMLEMAGTLESSDAANAGCTFGLAKNGVAIGRTVRWGPAQFVGNGLAALGVGSMGLQLEDAAIVGDFYEMLIGVDPGGVGGDDITLRDATITAWRRT